MRGNATPYAVILAIALGACSGGMIGDQNDAGETPDGNGEAADAAAQALGCPDTLPGEWIFCEDFESGVDPAEVFFEYNDDDGDFRVVSDQAASGEYAMEAVYQAGEVEAGWINVAFGRNPIVYGDRPHYRVDDDFEEIYWRFRLMHQAGWPDVGPAKVTRATSFAKQNWGQAMIAHLWSQGVVLLGDPASCVTGATVDCEGYNDFANLQWLGWLVGETEIFSSAESGRWVCIEGHVRLNTPGAADGVFEFWIDGNLENTRSDLDWRGGYTEYGLNLVSFENYWNGGSVAELRRWFDDIVISTDRIGCDS